MSNILIVDDDPQIRDLVRIALEREGFETMIATNGKTALTSAAQVSPDLIVLDIGLPEMDGLEVCRRIRKTSDVPILFLTARDEEIDKIVGFELGADDYVPKPFSPRELVARIKAILKRGRSSEVSKSLQHGALILDVARHDCRYGDTSIVLTATEISILEFLMKRPDRVATRPQLCDLIYADNPNASVRTIDSHLRNLRVKLEAAGCVAAIETVHGVGVRMGPCV